MPFTLLVNGSEHHVEAAAEESLLTVLRDRLELTGTKYGCGEGQCGACTVLLEGLPVRSCRIQANAVAGKKITTI
jgi:aerobic-type carbon monoxide dehydrogenase small subunit (CoxS/CutS family)